MKKRKPIFMVHKHHATKLHYDFRFEIDGKLKSWALKELPLKANKSVLAIQVPDHPFWYRHFEGVIPEGQYGAGPVMVWDKGLFENLMVEDKNNSLINSIKKGFLLLNLEGNKLKGNFILVRISKKQRWLMIKLNDELVTHGRLPKNWNNSIKSGMSLEQIFEKYSK